MSNKKRKLMLCVLIILVSMLSTVISRLPTYAEKINTADSIDNKIEKQNEDILDAVKDAGLKSSGEQLDNLIDVFEKSTQTEKKEISINNIKSNLQKTFFSIALSLRKYAVPFYMFILVSNVLLLSVIGSKSLQKRKAYIVGSILLTVVFIIMMNIPIFIIYFQSNPFSEVVTLDNTYNGAYRLVYFLRDNSLALCLILYVYGLINKQLGKNDLAKNITSKYFIKTACWVFVVLQILPYAINFIL